MFNFFGIKDFIFAAVAIIALLYIAYLTSEVSTLETDNKALNAQIISFEAVAKSAKAEADAKAEQTVKEIEVTKWKEKEKIKIVKEYVYDQNKSACDNAIARLRATGL